MKRIIALMIFMIMFGSFYYFYADWVSIGGGEDALEAQEAMEDIKKIVPQNTDSTANPGIGEGLKTIYDMLTFRVKLIPRVVGIAMFMLFTIPLFFFIYVEFCRDAPAPLNLILTAGILVVVGVLAAGWAGEWAVGEIETFTAQVSAGWEGIKASVIDTFSGVGDRILDKLKFWGYIG